jgi:hypothetical protein
MPQFTGASASPFVPMLITFVQKWALMQGPCAPAPWPTPGLSVPALCVPARATPTAGPEQCSQLRAETGEARGLRRTVDTSGVLPELQADLSASPLCLARLRAPPSSRHSCCAIDLPHQFALHNRNLLEAERLRDNYTSLILQNRCCKRLVALHCTHNRGGRDLRSHLFSTASLCLAFRNFACAAAAAAG